MPVYRLCVCVWQGKKRAVVLALDIVCDAVDRYKELCEGRYCGKRLASAPGTCGLQLETIAYDRTTPHHSWVFDQTSAKCCFAQQGCNGNFYVVKCPVFSRA